MNSIVMAAAGSPAGINFSGINILLGLIAGAVIMTAGIAIANQGRSGNFKQAADSGGAVMVGVIIFAIGASFTIASGAASSLVNWFFGK